MFFSGSIGNWIFRCWVPTSSKSANPWCLTRKSRFLHKNGRWSEIESFRQYRRQALYHWATTDSAYININLDFHKLVVYLFLAAIEYSLLGYQPTRSVTPALSFSRGNLIRTDAHRFLLKRLWQELLINKGKQQKMASDRSKAYKYW